MSFSTNGWDYIFYVNIDNLNNLISDSGISTLTPFFDGGVAGDLASLTISNFKVDYKSHYSPHYFSSVVSGANIIHKPDLRVILTASGIHDGNAFADALVECSYDLDWINLSNKLASSNKKYGKEAKPFLAYETSTDRGGLNPLRYKKFIETLNENIDAYIRNNIYDGYYELFSSLNKFSATNSWMNPSTQVFSVKKDLHNEDSNENCIFSFCCMIGDGTNKDIGFVDINAIPKGSDSALVIERSVFGKHMILPKFRDNVFVAKDLNIGEGKSLFDDTVSYTFRFPNLNEETKPDPEIKKLPLAAKDYIGVYKAWWGNDTAEDTQESGIVNEAIIRIEENLIRVILPKVTYHTSQTGWKLWTAQQEIDAYQEYEIFLNDYKEGVMDTQVMTKRFELKNEYKQAGLSKFLSLGGLQGVSTLITALKGVKKDDNRNFIKVIDTREINENSDIDIDKSTFAITDDPSEASPRYVPGEDILPRKIRPVYKKASRKDKDSSGTELQSVSEISQINRKIDYWDLLIKTTLIDARNALKPSKFDSELIDCIKSDKMLYFPNLYKEYLHSFHKITDHFQSNPAIYLSKPTIKKFKNYYNENKCELLPHKIVDKETRKEFETIANYSKISEAIKTCKARQSEMTSYLNKVPDFLENCFSLI